MREETRGQLVVSLILSLVMCGILISHVEMIRMEFVVMLQTVVQLVHW